MRIPHPKNARHRAWLYRVLSALYDDPYLAQKLCFKGGTCAAMLGYLDRFSVDLDFDFVGEKQEIPTVQKHMKQVFTRLKLKIDDQSRRAPQYFLKYKSPKEERNTIKIDVAFPSTKANKYEAVRFTQIDRIITCQTKDTMFANKLVALIGRHQKNGLIAGRDIYDIHHFFENGGQYNVDVLKERANKSLPKFFESLIKLIEHEVDDDLIARDINFLVPYEKFRVIRKFLKQETLMFLGDEISRLEDNIQQ